MLYNDYLSENWWEKYNIPKKETSTITYEGKHNTTKFPKFIKLLKKTQEEMKVYLNIRLREWYDKDSVVNEDGFLYARGTFPVLLVAHMDTTPSVGGTERVPVYEWYELEEDGKHTISSPQGIGGDDRCGIWTILEVLKTTDFRPSILFCEDEEIGCVGSEKFSKSKYISELKNLKFLVEIDRRGSNDIVYYEDDNEEWHKWSQEVTGYKEAVGSFTDICNLSEACGVSSCNLSSGYYSEHTLQEKIVVEEMMNTKDAVVKLLKAADDPSVEQFVYETRISRYSYSSYGSPYRSFYSEVTYGFEYVDKGTSLYDEYDGEDEFECIANFFIDHPNICWNDIVAYYNVDEWYTSLRSKKGDDEDEI